MNSTDRRVPLMTGFPPRTSGFAVILSAMTLPLIYFNAHYIEQGVPNEGGSYFVFGSGFCRLRTTIRHLNRSLRSLLNHSRRSLFSSGKLSALTLRPSEIICAALRLVFPACFSSIAFASPSLTGVKHDQFCPRIFTNNHG